MRTMGSLFPYCSRLLLIIKVFVVKKNELISQIFRICRPGLPCGVRVAGYGLPFVLRHSATLSVLSRLPCRAPRVFCASVNVAPTGPYAHPFPREKPRVRASVVRRMPRRPGSRRKMQRQRSPNLICSPASSSLRC